MSALSFENARPPSIPGEPPVPRSGGSTVQSSATDSFEQATKVCQKLWENLSSAIQQRERYRNYTICVSLTITRVLKSLLIVFGLENHEAV